MATSRLCSVVDCGKRHAAGGLCDSHYYRFKKYGDPHAGRPAQAPAGAPAAWLRSHVKHESDDCLFWPFSCFPNGYGQLVVNDISSGAHREMCRMAHGDPAPGMVAAHFCRNGRQGCVNPKHLRWATSSQNTHDRYRDGTMLTGQSNPASTISDAVYESIVTCKGKMTQREAAAAFGVCKSTVGNFWRGECARSTATGAK